MKKFNRSRRALRFLAMPLAAACLFPFENLATARAVPADTALTLKAKQTLWDDPGLDRLNLGVRVRNGVALLWGPVMKAEESREAIDRIRLISGIRSVVDETYVLPIDDPLRGSAQPIARASRTVIQPLSPPVVTAKNPNPDSPVVELLAPVPAHVEIHRQLQALIGRDSRFKGLTVSVADGQVTVAGRTQRPQDLWDFGNLARQVPGVKTVIFKSE